MSKRVFLTLNQRLRPLGHATQLQIGLRKSLYIHVHTSSVALDNVEDVALDDWSHRLLGGAIHSHEGAAVQDTFWRALQGATTAHKVNMSYAQFVVALLAP